ncbi:MAG: DUF1343 domain-containing protein, partial [Mycobacteriales bacterium]
MRRSMALLTAVGCAAAVVLTVSGGPVGAHGVDRARARGPVVQTGAQVLADSHYAELRGQKVGIIANPTTVLPDLRHVVDAMAGSSDVDLRAVFGPEHGFRGSAQAGGAEGYFVDPKTGLPVYDTYLKTPEQLADIFTRSGIDTVVFDIQDVGARFYTYIWTMYDSMRGAVLAGKRFVVLDRPNPLTGMAARGPVMTAEFETFIGRREISQQHGMTVGELARLFNAEFLPSAGGSVDLTVVQMRGWKRDMTFDETGLPWVIPSPNMPTVDTAYVYPGLGMFEGTNISEGRGSTRPFELVGAPFINGGYADALNALQLPGVHFREAYFTPSFSKYQGTVVGGVQVHVTDRAVFDALRTGVAMLVTAKQLYPANFQWRYDSSDPARPYWIDKVTGSSRLR